MSCPHGHPSRPEEEYGSGECYTCLEQVGPCGCDYCVTSLQKALDTSTLMGPAWYQAFLKKTIQTITKDNYHWALSLCTRDCNCTNQESEHDQSACDGDECMACAVVKCPRREQLHFHHDG